MNYFKLLAVLCFAAGGCDASDAATMAGFQGIVEYEERTLAFELSGRVDSLSVDEGVEVAIGDEIGKLDDTLETLARSVQQAQAHAARTRVALLEAGSRAEDIKGLKLAVAASKSTEQLASRTLERESSLGAKGIGRTADLDAAQAAKLTATARRRELEQQLARARHGARPEEVDVVVAEAEAAEAAVKGYDERISRHVLRSEHAGYVLEMHHEEGEFVGVGSAIATLADLSRPYVDVFVPQGQIDEAAVGQGARIRVDASAEPFGGRVEFISRRTEFTPKFLFSERERPNLVIRVRVRLEDPEHRLRAGVPAFVTVGSSTSP